MCRLVWLVLLGSVGPLPISNVSKAGAQGTAPPTYEECHSQVEAEPESWGSYFCFELRAQATGDLVRAKQEVEKVLERDPGRTLARRVLADLAAVLDPDRAEGLYRQVAEEQRSREQLPQAMYTHIELAKFLDRRGQTREAAEELVVARQVAELAAYPGLLNDVSFEEVRHLVAVEDYGAAWRLLRRMESAVFPEGGDWGQHRWLESVGNVGWYLGRHKRAFDAYGRDAELLRRMGAQRHEAVARNNLALLARPAGLGLEDQEVLAREALAVAIASGNRGAEAVAHARLAVFLEGSEEIQHAQQAVAIFRTRENLEALATALVDVERERALLLLDEAGDLVRKQGNRSEIARNAIVRSRLSWLMGPRDRAISDSLAALDAIEASRDLQPDSEVRARRFSQWGLAYEELVGHLLRGDLRKDPGEGVASESARSSDPLPTETVSSREDLELAFRVMERRRARGLLDELDAAHATEVLSSQSSGVGEREQGRFQAVLLELSGLQRQLLSSSLSEADRRKLLRSIEALEVDAAEARAALARRSPSFGRLHQPELAALDQVQLALPPDEAMLAFHLGRGEDSFVFAITGSTVEVVALPDRERLTSAVDLYLGLLQDARQSESRPAALSRGSVRLYRDLLAVALRRLPMEIERIVIVPDGYLHALPLGTLREAPGSSPVAVRYALFTAPSATTWLRWRTSPGSSRLGSTTAAGALALADPTVLGAEAGADPSSERAWALAREASLGPLPFARREGRSLVRRLGRGSRLLSAADATERFLKESDLTDFSVLHLAAHAVIDHEEPDRSSIVLAPGAETEDGLLQVREVVVLDLEGKLVVLSACQSASGLMVGGEGVLGLARAFFVAGAHAVIGSLWPLRDRQAAELFDDFYRHLGRGQSVAEALAAAQRARIAAGADPSEWAGLVLLGDGDLTPFPGGVEPSGRWFVYLVLGLGGLLALSVTVWSRRRG